jgi:tetratricopeptide (TPR) repeat protein
MKKPLIISIALLLVGGIVALLLWQSAESPIPEEIDIQSLGNLEPERQEAILRAKVLDKAYPFQKKADLLKWAYVTRSDFTITLVKENTLQIQDYPELLSRVSYELLNSGQPKLGIDILASVRNTHPNDPHVLGVTGYAAFLAGRKDEAREFLNQAESWQQQIPLVDFYLGGLLSQSDDAANRSRGKALLLRVVRADDLELGELAGFSIISNREVPVIAGEFKEVFDYLSDRGAFRSNNPNLNTPILRALLNRAIQLYPEAAMTFGELLLEYPGHVEADSLVFAQVAQGFGEVDRAGELIKELRQAHAPDEDSQEARLINRLEAIQLLLTGQLDESVEAFEKVIQANPGDPDLPRVMQNMRNAEMPISIEKRYLALMLKLDKTGVPISLSVLQRLLEIDPIRGDDWKGYAADQLLPENPGLVSAWLLSNGGAASVIEHLKPDFENADEASAISLVEAYLVEGQPEEAKQVLLQSADRINPANYAYLGSRIFHALGNNDMAYEKWEEAHNAAMASDAYPIIKNLGLLALELGQPVTALQSLYSALNAGIPFSERQSQTLLDLTLRFGTLRQSIKVAQFLNDTFTGNPVHNNNLAYFKFLAEEEVDSHVSIMRELSDQYPEITHYRLTLALGLLKVGRKNEAARLIQSTSIDWAEADSRAQLIYAVILSANDQRVVAEGLVRNIDMSGLILEEKALLETM